MTEFGTILAREKECSKKVEILAILVLFLRIMSKRLYVGNLEYGVENDDLSKLFGQVVVIEPINDSSEKSLI